MLLLEHKKLDHACRGCGESGIAYQTQHCPRCSRTFGTPKVCVPATIGSLWTAELTYLSGREALADVHAIEDARVFAELTQIGNA